MELSNSKPNQAALALSTTVTSIAPSTYPRIPTRRHGWRRRALRTIRTFPSCGLPMHQPLASRIIGGCLPNAVGINATAAAALKSGDFPRRSILLRKATKVKPLVMGDLNLRNLGWIAEFCATVGCRVAPERELPLISSTRESKKTSYWLLHELPRIVKRRLSRFLRSHTNAWLTPPRTRRCRCGTGSQTYSTTHRRSPRPPERNRYEMLRSR